MNQNATLYFGGPILTMEGPNPQALLVQYGKIAALGTRKQLSALAPHAQHRDLEGRALLPAFLDSHSHITALASTLELCQLGAASSFAEIAAKLRKFSIQHQLPTDAWVIGFGYDHNVLLERTHPTRQILDQVFPDRPVLITHASGHMGVANTAALERLEITAHTSDPTGGRIGRESDGKTPNGYLEEAAFFRSSSVMPVPTAQQALSQLTAAQQIYLSHGITLVQDGLTGPGQDALLSTLAEQDGLITDVVGYADQKQSPHLATRPPIGRYRIGGYKIFLDGSPQGRTAWMLSPYLGNDPTYHGYPIYTDDQVTAFVKQALVEGCQLLAHCNGDAAAAQYIRCCRRAQCETGRQLSTIRPVMIHAQLVQQEQLVEMAELGMIPSFLPRMFGTGGTCIPKTLVSIARPRSVPYAVPPHLAFPSRCIRTPLSLRLTC